LPDDNSYQRIPPGRPRTLERLVELFAPMARHWAFELHNGLRDHQRSLDDMEQDAWVGILEAWHTWSPALSKGGTFRNFANNRARWAVMNGQRHVDAGLARAYVNMVRARPGDEGPAALYHNVVAMESLDALRGQCGKSGLELTCDLSSEEALRQREGWRGFLRLLAAVGNPRTRMVLMGYFGLGLTLAQIGRELGVGHERVRQILVEGKRQIKEWLSRNVDH